MCAHSPCTPSDVCNLLTFLWLTVMTHSGACFSLSLQLILALLFCQLKDMAERLPPGAYDAECTRLPYLPNGMDLNVMKYPDMNGERHSRSDSIASTYLSSQVSIDASINCMESPTKGSGCNETNQFNQAREIVTSNGMDDPPDVSVVQACSNRSSLAVDKEESGPPQDTENGVKSRNSVVASNANQTEAEWIEQYEPGVYITLVALRDGTRDLKRVRFRYSHLFEFIFFSFFHATGHVSEATLFTRDLIFHLQP